MSYNKYCNQDLWCANSKLLCSKKLDYEQLTKLRFHFGFFALKTLRNTRSCTDEFTYYLNFSSGNYLSISDNKMKYVQSKIPLIHKIIELLAHLYIVTKKLNDSYPNKNYTLYEVLVVACKTRHYICIDFVSLNKFLDNFRGRILDKIKELTKNEETYYNYFPDYLAIIYLTRSERREKAYQRRKMEDHFKRIGDNITIAYLNINSYVITSHTNVNQIDNLINILINPNKITVRKLNHLRAKQL